jgi:hypothetical protein
LIIAMAADITPSKQVRHVTRQRYGTLRDAPGTKLTVQPQQAAAAIDSFKMESPVKKLDFSTADKENRPFDAEVATIAAAVEAATKKHVVEDTKKVEKPAVATIIKPAESDEPLLQENPQRFVLFPIRYHEVCLDASKTRKVIFSW